MARIALYALVSWTPAAVCWSQDGAQDAAAPHSPVILKREMLAILARLEAAVRNEVDDTALTKSTAGADAAVLAAFALRSRDSRHRELALQAHRAGVIIAAQQPDRRAQLAPALAELRKTVAADAGRAGKPVELDVAKVAPRPGLMWRMDRSLKLLREQITTAEQLTERKREVEHDIAVLRILAKLIGEDDYAFSDDAEFQQLRSSLTADADRMAKAAAAGDVEQLQLHRAAARETCKACHKSFRN